jgi:integrase
MAVYKDGKKWRVVYRYTDWQGETHQTQKRGFSTQREAKQWEAEQILRTQQDIDMNFASFVEIYTTDMKKRVRENTWQTKEHIIRTKIVPYFEKRKISEIQPKDIIAWQNEMLSAKNKNGELFSPGYLKTIHNQLSAIFNHAVRFYNLAGNPAAKVGNMGKERTKEMKFWTKEEYTQFSEAIMDKPLSFYAFEMLYWCGIRVGELLALTPADFDFERNTVSINKSYQRIKKQDVITDPKTKKSFREVKMPVFLVEEIKEYLTQIYGIGKNDRMFTVTKSYLYKEMKRGSKEAGVKKIRIHDLRHSHVSLLIELGYSAVAIADRVGHETIEITYRYAHLFPSVQNQMVRSLEDLRKEDTDYVGEKS